MNALKLRVQLEEYGNALRDIIMLNDETFYDFFKKILAAFNFDDTKEAVFYKSNEFWQKGKIISLDDYKLKSPVPNLLMKDTFMDDIFKHPFQKLLFEYDFKKQWIFHIELIGVIKDISKEHLEKRIVFSKGKPPAQYRQDELPQNKLDDNQPTETDIDDDDFDDLDLTEDKDDV